PQPIAGIVLGTIFVAGLLFLLVRDHDGHFYRYPYYGPYYRHYYRPEYRPYRGPDRDAPVRWGNGGRDGRAAPGDHGGRDLGRPQDHWAGNRAPVRQGVPPQWTLPAQWDTPSRWAPPAQRDMPSRWAPPVRQDGPARRGVNWDPRGRQDQRRGNKPDNRERDRRCEGSGNHQCGD